MEKMLFKDLEEETQNSKIKSMFFISCRVLTDDIKNCDNSKGLLLALWMGLGCKYLDI